MTKKPSKPWRIVPERADWSWLFFMLSQPQILQMLNSPSSDLPVIRF